MGDMETKDTQAPSQKSGSKLVLPGDQLASPEEFEAGSGSVVSGEKIVASTVGRAETDMANRVMRVVPAKENMAKLPVAGDYIVGSVQSAASSVAQVQIEAVNDIPSSKELSGMLSLRDDRHRRTPPPIKSGDTIRAKVISTKNAIYHLSLDDPQCGVLYTVCSVCGGRVVALGRDRVKCAECGWVDDRMLSEEFLVYSRSQH